MIKLAAKLLILVVALASGCDKKKPVPRPAASSASSAPRPTAAGLSYVEHVTGGAKKQGRLPLIIALHGLGDRPDSFVGIFDGLDAQARVVALRAPHPWHGGYSWFGMGNDAALAAGIRRAADQVARAIQVLARQRPTLGRPIVTGFSQGGMLAFAIVALYPTRVAAAFPMGGLLPPPLRPKARPAGPLPEVVALQGQDDPRVPIEKSRSAVAALRALGYRAELRPFPGVPHAVPYTMRHELYGLLEFACKAQRSSPSRQE